MFNKINNDKGFGLVFILLPLALIILIFGIGLYVYSENKNKAELTTTPTKTESLKLDKVDSSPSNKTTDVDALTYLEFKDLGVKMALTDKIKDAYVGNTPDTRRLISTHYFDNKIGFEGCRVNSESGGILAINAARVGDDNFGSPWTEAELESTGSKKIGDIYYRIVSGGAPCWNPDEIPESDPVVQKYFEIKKEISEQQNTLTKI